MTEKEKIHIMSAGAHVHETFPIAVNNISPATEVYVIVEDRVYVFTDATVNIEPNAEDLAEIACLAANFAKQIGIEPRVAMLSFSNFGSSIHPLSEKVRRAVEIARAKNPDLEIDGEMQADTAVMPEIIENRYSFSQVRASSVVMPSSPASRLRMSTLAFLPRIGSVT